MPPIFYYKKNIFTSVFLPILILTLQSFLFAQTGTVRGTVLDKVTEEPLVGANVIIDGTSIGAATDLDGKFIIRKAPTGSQTLTISYIGYDPVKVNVNIVENRTLEEQFFLEYKTVEGETVTITAQAEGQLGAINQQLSSNTIANVVSKDRIKELPDVNAAETIGRLPGVSIQRSGGEATKVEIRGLNPKYSLVTVNGVEVPSTGSADRSVDLSLISSNMLDGITLKKSNTPDMDADVLGGTIDLRLKEASKNLQLNVSAQGGYNELQDYYGNYNFTAGISNRFLDNQLGLIANVNTDNYDRSADKFDDDWINRNNTIVTGELNLREEQVNRKRTGASLLLDYILPNGKVTANGFYNQLNSEGLFRINQIYSTVAAFNTNRHFYTLEQNEKTTNVFTSALGVSQDFDWIRYDASVSRSGTATSDPDRRQWNFNQEQSALDPEYTATTHPKDLPKFINADTSITNFASLFRFGTRIIENTTSAKLNFEVPFRFGNQLSGFLKTGGKLRWIDRSNDQKQYGYSGLQYGSGATNPVFRYINDAYPEWNIDDVIEEYGLLNIQPFLTDYSRSNFLNGDYPLGLITNRTMLNQITDALIAANDRNLWAPYSVGTFGFDYKGFERYEAAYLMAELNLGDYLTLIPGVRWEEEFSSYHGQRYRVNQPGQTIEQPPSDFVRLTKVRRNKFWLPMVNLIVKPTEWLQVRLARTETLARPDFLRYAPISYINANSTFIEAANYSLKPSQSTNYDVGVALFNNEIGLFSVTAFYKDIEDLIFYSTFSTGPGTEVDPSLEIPESWLTSFPRINTYRNNPDPAKYSGYEIEWQTNFWYLPSVFSGLVLNVNYTHIYSEMKLAYDSLIITQPPPRVRYALYPTNVKTRMPDQPAHIFNITVGYDLYGFSARLSYLYITDKLTSIGYEGVVPSPRLSTYRGDYGRWDLSLQQKIFQNIQVFANFTNMNGRPDEDFVGSDLNHPSYIEYYGFTMDLGVRYNF